MYTKKCCRFLVPPHCNRIYYRIFKPGLTKFCTSLEKFFSLVVLLRDGRNSDRPRLLPESALYTVVLPQARLETFSVRNFGDMWNRSGWRDELCPGRTSVRFILKNFIRLGPSPNEIKQRFFSSTTSLIWVLESCQPLPKCLLMITREHRTPDRVVRIWWYNVPERGRFRVEKKFLWWWKTAIITVNVLP